MDDKHQKIKVAVVQASPILFNREATIEKTCRLIHKAAEKDIKLLLFPEAFIPAYPRGLSFGAVVGSRSTEGSRTWQRYWGNAVDVPGPDVETMGKAVREAGVYLAAPSSHRLLKS